VKITNAKNGKKKKKRGGAKKTMHPSPLLLIHAFLSFLEVCAKLTTNTFSCTLSHTHSYFRTRRFRFDYLCPAAHKTNQNHAVKIEEGPCSKKETNNGNNKIKKKIEKENGTRNN